MANSYTAIPNIVPGNLRVQGNLTVAGGQFILGALQRKYRIQELGNGNFYETVNLDTIAVSQDDPTVPSGRRRFDGPNIIHEIHYEAAGTPAADGWLVHYDPNAAIVTAPELRVGVTTPYVRLRNLAAIGGWMTVNLQADGATRDDLTKFGFQIGYNQTGFNCSTLIVDTAGNNYTADLRRVFWLDHTTHSLPGILSVTNVGGKTIYGNQLGVAGCMHIQVTGKATTIAAGNVLLYVTYGAPNILPLNVPASTNTDFWLEVLVTNQGASNSQIFSGFCRMGATVQALPPVIASVDSTVNQLFNVNYQTAQLGDSLTIYNIEAEFLSRAANI